MTKAATSPLSSAPLDRARDTLILAQKGNLACQRLWNDFAAERPAEARVVAAWVQKDDAKRAEATARVDATLERAELVTKARTVGVCLQCHSRLKAKWPKCRKCGAKSRLYRKAARVKKLKARPKKSRRMAAKAVQAEILTKAAGTGERVDSRGAAIRSMLRADLGSPDPGRRMAAAQALRNLGA